MSDTSYNWNFTYEAFTKVFIDLATISEDQFNFYRSLGPSYIDIAYYFGNLSKEEQDNIAMLVLAHLLSLSLRGANGGSGPVSNASEGSVSVGFATLKNMNWWQQTPYGAMFWSLFMRYTSPFLVSGSTGSWL